MRRQVYLICLLLSISQAHAQLPSNATVCLGIWSSTARHSILETNQDETSRAYQSLRDFRRSLGLWENSKWRKDFFFKSVFLTSREGTKVQMETALRVRAAEKFYENHQTSSETSQTSVAGLTLSGSKPVTDFLITLRGQLEQFQKGESRANTEFFKGQRKFLTAGSLIGVAGAALFQEIPMLGTALLAAVPSIVHLSCREVVKCRPFPRLIKELEEVALSGDPTRWAYFYGEEAISKSALNGAQDPHVAGYLQGWDDIAAAVHQDIPPFESGAFDLVLRNVLQEGQVVPQLIVLGRVGVIKPPQKRRSKFRLPTLKGTQISGPVTE